MMQNEKQIKIKKKCVIFSCSLKSGQYSNSKSWAELMKSRLERKEILAEIINLKDFDYEATTHLDKDLLHEKLSTLYDADLVIIAAPTNLKHMSFPAKNLIDRFVYAHKKGKEQGIDIFQNKIWEYCAMFSAPLIPLEWGKQKNRGIDKNYKTQEYNLWDNHHGYALQKLNFMQHLGLDETAVSTYHPDVEEDPSYHNMHTNKHVLKMCDEIVEEFEKKSKKLKAMPSCSIDKFITMFENKDQHAFGRGMTLKAEKTDMHSVKAHIVWLNENVDNIGQ
jgi:hypothetical protein